MSTEIGENLTGFARDVFESGNTYELPAGALNWPVSWSSENRALSLGEYIVAHNPSLSRVFGLDTDQILDVPEVDELGSEDLIKVVCTHVAKTGDLRERIPTLKGRLSRDQLLLEIIIGSDAGMQFTGEFVGTLRLMTALAKAGRLTPERG